MKMKIIIGAISVSLITLVLGMIFNPSLTFSVLGFILMLGLFYLGSCFRTISAERAGLKIFLEKPKKKKVYSGEMLFVFWPLEKLKTWPKQQQHIDLPHQEIISASGEVDGKKYSQAKVEVDPVFYYHWPVNDVEKLTQAYEYSPGPDDKENLKEFFGQFVTSIVRHRLGSITWLETRQGEIRSNQGNTDGTDSGKPEELSEFIHKELMEKDVGNPIIKAGLEEVRVEFKKVKLPDELEAAISAPQVAEYHATAAKITADGEREKRTKEGEGDAAARKAIFKAIKEAGEDGIQMETLHTLRRMAQGTSNTILYGLPPKVANVLSGDYKPDAKELAVFAEMLVEFMADKGLIVQK